MWAINGFRAALAERGITACIPPRKNRKVEIDYDKQLDKQRHKIENVFGRVKDWRRDATRYNRCATPSCMPSPSPQLLATGCDRGVLSLGHF